MRTVGVLWRMGRVPSPVTQRFLQEFVTDAQSSIRALGLQPMS